MLNITWLQDANYAKTSGYDADGWMNWNDAVTWAANLNYGGYTDWRLSTMIDTDGPDADALGNDGCDFAYSGTDCGWNVQTMSCATVYSELAYMYYVNLGLLAGYDASGNLQSNLGIFGNGTANGIDSSSYGENNVGLIHNLQAFMYWSGVEAASNGAEAWRFSTYSGYQVPVDKSHLLFAWAVRPGDVHATGSGLGQAVAWVIRRFGRFDPCGGQGAIAPCGFPYW